MQQGMRIGITKRRRLGTWSYGGPDVPQKLDGNPVERVVKLTSKFFFVRSLTSPEFDSDPPKWGHHARCCLVLASHPVPNTTLAQNKAFGGFVDQSS